jgi:hypothetical protein
MRGYNTHGGLVHIDLAGALRDVISAHARLRKEGYGGIETTPYGVARGNNYNTEASLTSQARRVILSA